METSLQLFFMDIVASTFADVKQNQLTTKKQTKMKKSLPFFFALAAIAASVPFISSCSKNSDPLTPENRVARLEVQLQDLKVSNHAMFATKAFGGSHGDNDADKAKNTLQLYVFNENEQLENYRCLTGDEVSDETKLTFDVVEGTKKVWAVANSHSITEFSNIKTVEELGKITADLKKENAGDFTMAGSNTVDAEVSPTPSTVTLDLKRLVSRIHVGSIKTDMSGGYADDSIVNAKIYLINVYNKSLISTMSGKTGCMMNKKAFLASDTAGFAMKDIVYTDIPNIKKESQNIDQYFYAYGNNGAEGKTKLVIEGKLGSKTYYYPICITDKDGEDLLSANTSLNITDITITRPGSEDPDVDVEYGAVKFTVNVVDWAKRDSSNVVF